MLKLTLSNAFISPNCFVIEFASTAKLKVSPFLSLSTAK